MKKFQVITLFPEMFTGVFETSMMWKAQKGEIVQLSTVDLREFGLGPRRQVDDTPFGGGDGMLLKPEPLFAAVESALRGIGSHPARGEEDAPSEEPKQFVETKIAIGSHPIAKRSKVLLMTPRGRRWNQAMAREYAESGDDYIFICGRYEGYDERILALVDQEISVGGYVLTGGELPAMTIVDSIVRLMPGVLGGETSAEIESFSDGETLEFPQYTRPAEFRGMKVPDVLLSGNHGEIAKWRQAHSKKAHTQES